MSLYNLSSTLAWQSPSDPNLDDDCRGPRAQSPAAKTLADSDSFTLHPAADLETETSGALTCTESAGATDYEIGLESAATNQGMTDDSSASSELVRNATQTGIVYEFSGSPAPAVEEVYVGHAVKLPAPTTRTAAATATASAALDEESSMSKKSHGADTATYHGSEKNSTVLSSVRQLMENVQVSTNAPVSPPPCMSPPLFTTEQGSVEEEEEEEERKETERKQAPTSAARAASLVASPCLSPSPSPLPPAALQRVDSAAENLRSSASLKTPSTEPASTALRWRVGAQPQPLPTSASTTPATRRESSAASPLGSLEFDGHGNYYYFLPGLHTEMRAETAPAPQRKEEERLVALPHPPHQTGLSTAAASTRPRRDPQDQQLRRPEAEVEFMTPLSLVHGRRLPPATAEGVHGAEHKETRAPRPAVPRTAQDAREDDVPTVVASNRVLRRRRPSAAVQRIATLRLRGVQPATADVAVLRGSILQSSAHVHRFLSRHNSTTVSICSAIESDARASALDSFVFSSAVKRTQQQRQHATPPAESALGASTVSSSSLSSVRTVHPRVPRAVFDARFRMPQVGSGAPTATTTAATTRTSSPEREVATPTKRTGERSDGTPSTRKELRRYPDLPLADLLRNRNAAARPAPQDSFSTVRTVVIANPSEAAVAAAADGDFVAHRIQPTPAAPAAPPRAPSKRARAPRQRPSAPSPIRREADVPRAALLNQTNDNNNNDPDNDNDDQENSTRVNLRELTREIGREYDLMTASFAEMLYIVPRGQPVTAVANASVTSGPKLPAAAPLSAEATAAATEMIAQVLSPVTPVNTCVYVQPRTPRTHFTVPTSTTVTSAASLVTQTPADMTPFEAPLTRQTPCSAHPRFQRYPSHVTPASIPCKGDAAAEAPSSAARPPATTSPEPLITDTAPTPSKKMLLKSRLATTRRWLARSPTWPAAAAPAAATAPAAAAEQNVVGAATPTPKAVVSAAPKPRPSPKSKKLASPVVAPATAAIKAPSMLMPSPYQLTPAATPSPPPHSAADSADSIPLVRQRRPSTEQQLSVNDGNATAKRRTDDKAAAAAEKKPVLPPINPLQLALIPSDDISVLQTPRNDSSYDPSQASPEWKDVPMPVLRRSLIRRMAPDDVHAKRVDTPVFTAYHNQC